MSTEVRAAYDAMAERYAALFLTDLDQDDNARAWLASFAALAAGRRGPVADLGCGPGHVVDHLSGLGLDVVGYDLSPGQVAQARLAFPAERFDVCDLTAIDRPDRSLGGIVSRYSIIHLDPSTIAGTFGEWYRVLERGAPVLVSFFGSLTADAHGTPFDHKVVTAHELFPAEIARLLTTVGFGDVEVGVLPAPDDALRPFDQATIMARVPGPIRQ
ncbi:MAG: class I SAM-dependent methyltransferase [Actinomycetota bacterium]